MDAVFPEEVEKVTNKMSLDDVKDHEGWMAKGNVQIFSHSLKQTELTMSL